MIENGGHRPDCDTRCQNCAVSYCEHPECVHPRSAPSHLRRDENCAVYIWAHSRFIRCDCFDMTYPGEIDKSEPDRVGSLDL